MELPSGNRILDRVAGSHLAPIMHNARIVTLPVAQLTTVHDRPMQTVDFPITALLSVLGTLADGSTAEITTVGSEGFVEIDAALHHAVAKRTSICLFAGDVVRIPVADFQRGLREEPDFADLVYHAVRARAYVTEQLTMCGVLHSTEQRLARWLLLTMYKLRSPVFPITQESIAGLLGTRRASISVAAKAMSDAGAVRYSRGMITVLDPAALAARSCECYEDCRGTIEELL
jgi:CRP-like cAMP-binding protein